MSFSYEVKEELSRNTSNQCCQKAELSAVIRMAGNIKIAGGQGQAILQIQTEHASTARRTYKLLKKFLKSPVDIMIRRNSFLKDHNLYIISVDLRDSKEFLKELGILREDQEKFKLRDGIKHSLIKKRCCMRSYLRGAFLGSGSISDPKGPYHVEFVTQDKRQAADLSRLMNSFGLNSKVMERKNAFMVYLKDGNHIADLLGIMGAHNSLLKFEDIRVVKEMRNSVNRIVNCETANLNKTVDASIRQIECINFLKERRIFEDLPDNLKEIAELRVEHPDLSLKELGEMMEPPLGKSGVSYRLKKIESIAENLQSMKGEKNHV